MSRRYLKRGLGRRIFRLRSWDQTPHRNPTTEAARLETIRRAMELADSLEARGFRFENPILRMPPGYTPP